MSRKPKPLPPLFAPSMIAERRCVFRTDRPEQFFAAFKFHPGKFEVIRLTVGQTQAQWIFGVQYPEPKQQELI